MRKKFSLKFLTKKAKSYLLFCFRFQQLNTKNINQNKAKQLLQNMNAGQTCFCSFQAVNWQFTNSVLSNLSVNLTYRRFLINNSARTAWYSSITKKTCGYWIDRTFAFIRSTCGGLSKLKY